MVVATAMRGVKALGARNQSCLQSGPWVESDMNPAGFCAGLFFQDALRSARLLETFANFCAYGPCVFNRLHLSRCSLSALLPQAAPRDPLVLKNGQHLACHPEASASNNVLVFLHQGALLFLPQCHSCDIIKLIGINTGVIYAFNIHTDNRLKATAANKPNQARCANHQDGNSSKVAMEQSETAQCPTLLHGKPPAVKGDDTACQYVAGKSCLS